MQVNVSGKQVDIGESFRHHVEKRLTETLSKYLERMTGVQVVASRESHLFRVDISGNTGTHAGVWIKSSATAEDIYACFDAAADKVEKQLRRYKRRLTNHHKKSARQPEPIIKARKYVLAAQEEAHDEKEEAAPVVIAEKATDIETLTVSEAVMKMDLADLPALMFFNSAHGRVNVVYRREDGNISWVDPEGKAA